MIEVKNICKTYRPKKGVPVKALDNVSLKFDDTGMVFILGKSGSGKSTLLNVLGGLDSYDSGEFIIQGKSSNNFTQSDFDSYRNTLIGFIFQEYNILNDFTVGANIALAMQLQGKKATNEALNDILEQVDLVGYGDRKPNELSGGQKQRVAIARALIKEPRIIMADEPTGALDSNTGKQVFDTLKKLSKEKLVIIVSHDREFAEYYGDRVIELADGQIISDITKYTAESKVENEGIAVIDDKILHIKKGYKLTATDLDLINNYLANSSTDTIISVDEKSNESFKQVAMIDDNGNKKSFKDTSEVEIADNSNGESVAFIKSRMPFKHAFKMGASGLKHKKFRLVITIFLSLFAFCLFGLADTFAAYDEYRVNVESLLDSGMEQAVFVKQNKMKDDYEWYRNTKAKDEDVAKVKEETGVDTIGVLNVNSYVEFKKPTNLEAPYYNFGKGMSNAATLTEKDLGAFGDLMGGHLPVKKDEVVITKYAYDMFALAGYKNYDKNGELIEYEPSELNTVEKFLAKDIYVSISIGNNGASVPLKVVGVLDTHFDTKGKYEELKTDKSNNWMLSGAMQNELSNSLHNALIISKELNDQIKNGAIDTLGLKMWGEFYSYDFHDDGQVYYDNILNLSDTKANFYTTFKGSSLGENQMLISLSRYFEILNEELNWDNPIEISPLKFDRVEYSWDEVQEKPCIHVIPDEEITTLNELISNKSSLIYEIIELNNITFSPEQIEQAKTELKDRNFENIDNVEPELVVAYYWNENPQLIPKEVATKLNELILIHIENETFLQEFINPANAEDGFSISWSSSVYSDEYKEDSGSAKVVGIFADAKVGWSSEYEDYYRSIVVADSIYAVGQNAMSDIGYYNFLVGKMPKDRTAIEKMVAGALRDIDGIRYGLTNEVSDTLDMFGSMIKEMSKYFIYAGIVLALFAALLLMNFITTSISYKKREIGILRAVGARSSDVFAIFFYESAIIAAINFVLSLIGTIVVCAIINNVFRNQLGLALTLLNVGIRQVALLFGVSLLVAFAGSFFPVMKIARKRPIDAIQNR